MLAFHQELSTQVSHIALIGRWHAPCDLTTAGRRRAGRASNRGHRDAQLNERGRRTTAKSPLACRSGCSCLRPYSGATRPRRGYDQGRHSPFAFRNHGDQRDDAEGRGAHAHRRAEQEGRRTRQEARGGRGRSGLELAAVRGEGPRVDQQGQGRRRVRLLDVGVAQIRAAGVQGAQQHPVLSGAVRRRRERAQRILHRCRTEPAGHPRRRLSGEQGRRLGEALGAGRHRLRLSAHDQQDPRGLPERRAQGGARGHHDQLHSVRLLRLADRSLQDQGVRLGGQEDGGGVDHQRRRQRAVL